jgi:hypothetical protein
MTAHDFSPKEREGAVTILKIQRRILQNLLKTRQEYLTVGMPTRSIDRDIGLCLRLMGGISAAW